MPKKLLAWTTLTIALAAAILPGVADSQVMRRPPAPVADEAFRDLAVIAEVAGVTSRSLRVEPLDPAYRSASYLAEAAPLVDVGHAGSSSLPSKRPSVRLAAAAPGRVWNTPRYSVTGEATWYDNGTTAMRLPRGTVVVICGESGCVERTITDYGPGIPRRVVDLMPSDFVAVCGCALWQGITKVTVRIY